MPQADGTIVIDTEIQADGFREGGKEIESAVKRLAKQVEGIGTTAKKAVDTAVKAFVKLNQTYAAQEREVENLRNKVSEYGNQKIPTEEYRKIQSQIDQARAKMDRLTASQEKFLAMGGSKNSKRFKGMTYDINQLSNTIKYAQGELSALENSGKAFIPGTKTKEAAADMERLAAAEERLKLINKELNGSYVNVKNTFQKYGVTLRDTASEVGIVESTMNGLKLAAHAPISILSKLGSALKKLPANLASMGIEVARSSLLKFSTAVKTAFSNLAKITGKGIVAGLKRISSGILGIHKTANKTSMSLGKMLGTSLLFSVAFRAISAVTNGIKEGLQNLAQYSGTTNSSLSMLVSSLETLKNSFATAFAPILNVVAPILSSFINMISTAVSYIGMFIAALTGQKTYTKALGVQKDYAAGLEDTAGAAQDAADATDAAAEAAERYLSPLDDINRYTDQNNGSGGGSGSPGGGGGGGIGTGGPLFEEVPIKSSIAGLAQKIKDLIKAEDFEGLGAFIADGINRGMAKIKEAISWENVGPTVTYFVTAFTTTFNSLVDHLDWDLLGRTIGEGVNTVVNTLNLLITQIDWENLGHQIAVGFNGLFDEVNFENLGMLIGNKFMILPNIVYGFVRELDWSLIGIQIANALNGIVDSINLSTLGANLGLIITGICQAAIEFSKTFDWNQLGTNIYQGINSVFQNLDGAVIGKGLSDFVTGVLDSLIVAIRGIDLGEVTETLKAILVNIDWMGIVQRIAELFGYALGAIVGMLAKLLGDAIGNAATAAKDYFQDKIEEAGGNVVDGILLGITDALASIGEWINKHIFQPIIDGFKNAFGINSPSTVMAEMGKYLMEGLFQGITSLVDKVFSIFEDIREKISEVWENIKVKTSEKWNEIKSSLRDIWEGLKISVSNVFTRIKNTIGDTWNNVKDTASNVWENIKTKLTGIWEGMKTSVSNIFEYIKNKIVDVWNSIRDRTSSIWSGIQDTLTETVNGIIGAINGMIRGLVNGMNSVIRALNRIHITVPEWVPEFGGRKFGFNIGTISAPQIPYLASGAVIPPNKEFLAVLGDQKSGNNIEAPESLIRRIVREETGRERGGSYEFVAQLNRRTIFRQVIEEGKLTRVQTGKNPFELA